MDLHSSSSILEQQKIKYSVTENKQTLVETHYTNGAMAPQRILPNIPEIPRYVYC